MNRLAVFPNIVSARRPVTVGRVPQFGQTPMGPEEKNKTTPPTELSPAVSSENPPIQPADTPQVKQNNKVSLATFIQDLLTQGGQDKLEWVSTGLNLETTLNGYPVRLSEIQPRAQYKLQIFPKGWFSGFRAPMYNIDAPVTEAVGQDLAKVFQQALQSLPELYDSDSGRNKGLRVFEIGRSRYALVFPQKRTDAQLAAGKESVLFLVKPKTRYYGFTLSSSATPESSANPPLPNLLTTLKPISSEGYVDNEDYFPLSQPAIEGQAPKQGLSRAQFLQILNNAGLTVEKIIAKGKKLLQEV